MNTYTFEELNVGMKESFTVTVTDEMMEAFRQLSGDVNPLHCDEDYATRSGFPGRVVYGMLTAAFYSTLAGVYLPGERSILQGVDSKFRSPVYIGDTLTVTGRVAEKNDTFRMITVKAEIFNQQGKKISKATLQVGVR